MVLLVDNPRKNMSGIVALEDLEADDFSPRGADLETGGRETPRDRASRKTPVHFLLQIGT